MCITSLAEYFMKKILLLILTLSSTISFSQNWQTGFRIGAGASKFTRITNPSNVIYLTGGGVATYQLSRFVDINAEALVAFQGTEYDGVQEQNATLGFERDQPFRGDMRIFSLKVPVYPGFHFGSEELQFKLHAGPSMELNLYAYESRDYLSEEIEDVDFEKLYRVTPFTASMIYGAGVRVKVREGKYMLIDFRYSNGLIYIFPFGFDALAPVEARLNYFSISAGYLF